MRTLLFIVTVTALAGTGYSTGSQPMPVRSKASRAPRLFKDSRQTLAIARAQGRSDITLVVAAVQGRTAAAAQEATRLGGDVRYRDEEVGYLRVRIPIEKATEFSESDSVETAATDRDDTYPGRLLPDAFAEMTAVPSDEGLLQAAPPADSGITQSEWPPRLGDYPLRHPYSPIKDIGAVDFLGAHPTYDGRGVTIALLDGNFDLLLPEFQTAYTVDGRRVAKVADYLNVTDPRDDAELMPQWVDMQNQILAHGRQVSYKGKTFTVPHEGTFRIGLFSERRFNNTSNAAYIDQDIDRDGNPRGDDGLFGVLWDESTNTVWVDTNRNLNFADEKPMTDYGKRQDVGLFGKDDPTTPVRDSIGFAVQTDPQNKFVSINVGIYQHATEIMGSVVGNRDPNGRVSGVAPGSSVVSMYFGVGILHAAIEGLIRAFKHPQVDLVVFEQHVGMATIPYLLADAHHPISIIVERLTDRYNKLLFVPGSNSPGLAVVGEDGLAPSAVSVGAYQSRESYLANWGFVTDEHDNLHWGGLSHGPSGIGALKPDLLAPSGQISTDPGYRKGQMWKGLFQLPPGYSVDGGTSTATPMACGAAALVVSAAKQNHVPYDARRLKAALVGSARFVPRLAPYEQGNGLIQVVAAFELLKKLQSVQPVTITSRASVKTALSHLLPTPNEGVGLYEREGWKAGDHGERTIVLTRASGSAEPMKFTISWQGNDGTFSSASSIALPLNQPTSLPVSIAVKEPGAHSAILTLDHPSLPGHAYRMLNTIVAALPLSAENKFTAKSEVTVLKPGDRGVFVDVPPGAAALTFSATAKDVALRLSAISPDRNQISPCPTTTTAPSELCAVPNPSPGVWEINVANNNMAFDPEATQPSKPVSVTVTAAVLAIDVTASLPSGPMQADRAVSFPVTLKNRFGAVTAAAASVPLGSAFQTRRSIAQGEQHLYEITVPKGTSSLRAKVSGVADANADLDVYLFDCTSPEKRPAERWVEKDKGNKSPNVADPLCAPRAKASDVDTGGEVEVANPAPGRWVVIVDAFSVPVPQTTYSYIDVFAHPGFGAIATSDVPENHEVASTWTVGAHAWSAALPAPPRQLLGRLTITSQEVRTGDRRSASMPIPLGSVDLVFGDRTRLSSQAGPPLTSWK